MNLYNVNTQQVRAIILQRYRSVRQFCLAHNFHPTTLTKILSDKKCTEYMLRKVSDALGVEPQEISDYGKAVKPYWWVSDSDYPVDVEFCRKCWIWNEYARCCDYLERKGCLRPDNTIVIEKNGRHTCSVRELKSKSVKRKNGVYKNSTKW